MCPKIGIRIRRGCDRRERSQDTFLASTESRRSVWRAKYRLPDGRQIQTTIGRAWTERGRPPAGYFTKRTAQTWLRDVLDQAERGVLPGMVRTGRTFAHAAEEYLRYPARIASASRRPCATRARSSATTCCPSSAIAGSRTSPSRR
jgi:hypothetical protein